MSKGKRLYVDNGNEQEEVLTLIIEETPSSGKQRDNEHKHLGV